LPKFSKVRDYSNKNETFAILVFPEMQMWKCVGAPKTNGGPASVADALKMRSLDSRQDMQQALRRYVRLTTTAVATVRAGWSRGQ
jgi:hypothetical protein